MSSSSVTSILEMGFGKKPSNVAKIASRRWMGLTISEPNAAINFFVALFTNFWKVVAYLESVESTTTMPTRMSAQHASWPAFVVGDRSP